MSDDIITIYGQTMNRPKPMEPMTPQELALSKIPQARLMEFNTLRDMCETSCKYCGFTFKEYGYGTTRYYSPFTCKKDAIHRVCRGKSSQYRARLFRGTVKYKDYEQCYKKGYYTDDLHDFDWFQTDIRRPSVGSK